MVATQTNVVPKHHVLKLNEFYIETLHGNVYALSNTALAILNRPPPQTAILLCHRIAALCVYYMFYIISFIARVYGKYGGVKIWHQDAK